MTDRRKTGKREVAVVQLILWWGCVGVAVYSMVWHPESSHRELRDLVAGIGIYVNGFAAGAFGVEWYSSQLKPADQAEKGG